jgi:hypothetical protein
LDGKPNERLTDSQALEGSSNKTVFKSLTSISLFSNFEEQFVIGVLWSIELGEKQEKQKWSIGNRQF